MSTSYYRAGTKVMHAGRLCTIESFPFREDGKRKYWVTIHTGDNAGRHEKVEECHLLTATEEDINLVERINAVALEQAASNGVVVENVTLKVKRTRTHRRAG